MNINLSGRSPLRDPANYFDHQLTDTSCSLYHYIQHVYAERRALQGDTLHCAHMCSLMFFNGWKSNMYTSLMKGYNCPKYGSAACANNPDS